MLPFYRPLLTLLIASFVSLAVNARGAIVITAERSGDTAVFSYTGSLDVSGLTSNGSYPMAETGISPANGELRFGTGFGLVDQYSGGVITSSPAAFGTSPIYRGGLSFAGDAFAIVSGAFFYLPLDYVSGSTINGAVTFGSFTDLGLIPGSYVWEINGGANGNTVTLNVVPEPSIFLFSGIGLGGMLLRRRRCVA